MVKAKIRLLVIVDTKVDFLDEVEKALEMQRRDYLEGSGGEVDVVWEIKRQDLSNLPWREYWGNNYGVSAQWVREDTAKIREKHGSDFDSIAYVIDWDNWTTEGNGWIWGWNLGTFYPDRNGYQVQLIKAGRHSLKALYYTFLMELFHAHDDFYYRATGKRLETIFNVTDFDEDVVHALHDDYQVFKYIPVIQEMKDVLVDLFRIKEEKQSMYGELFNDPSGNGKVWFVRNGKRSHANNSKFLAFVWDWKEVKEISREDFALLEETAPVGFEQDFKSSWIKNLLKFLSI